MPVPILAARHVHKTYGRGPTRFDALRGVSLDIDEGDSIAVVGKSGSGKSTLMHLLALLDEPSDGTVELSGLNAAALPKAVLNQTRNETFGFVFQQFFLTANTSVLDNVTLPLRIAGKPAADRRRRGMAALEQLEMADKADAKAGNLSGGQKQRVVIARALVNRPSVIFADEPTGNLDSTTGHAVQDILLDLNQNQGITLVLVTHDDDFARRMDRQVYLRDGRVVDVNGVDVEQRPARSRRPLVTRAEHREPQTIPSGAHAFADGHDQKGLVA